MTRLMGQTAVSVFCASIVIAMMMASAPCVQAEEDYLEKGPHHLSVFLGGTRLDDDEDTTDFTAGIDYEYRVNRLLGIGAVVEHAFGDVDATTALVVMDIHIYKGFIVQTGPGYEWPDAEEEDDRFVYRLGGLYEFEVGEFTVSPQLHIDFAEDADDALVFGVAFGRAF